MGSGNSRLGGSGSGSGSPPRRPKVNRTKHRLSSLFCGASSTSSSSSSSLREDCAGESLICSSSTDDRQHLYTDDFHTPTTRVSTETSMLTSFAPPETTTSSSTGNTSRIGSSSNNRKCVSESHDMVVLPHETKLETKPCTRQLPLVPNSIRNPITDADDFLTTNDSPSFLQDNIDEEAQNHSLESTPIPTVYGPDVASQSPGDEALQDTVTPGLGLLVSDTSQIRPEGSLLHVNVVSVSSNILPSINNEVSTRESRRNSRRMFWDAFSTRSSTRLAEYPALLLTREDADFTGSRRRWLLDIGDNIFDDEFGSDSVHLDRRSRLTTERRRNSRSEFWDRLRGAATDSRHHDSCPLGLHSDGSCTCELDGEASALSSISRIVLLAEALFEVLDEIHHQPNFSLSLSVPAPESVVDALPLRTYKKSCTTGYGDDVDQCYICLVEYEEGEKIRVLPCRHEYHMSCVDKWLKEIHGICPLCRGEIAGEDAASSSEALIA